MLPRQSNPNHTKLVRDSGWSNIKYFWWNTLLDKTWESTEESERWNSKNAPELSNILVGIRAAPIFHFQISKICSAAQPDRIHPIWQVQGGEECQVGGGRERERALNIQSSPLRKWNALHQVWVIKTTQMWSVVESSNRLIALTLSGYIFRFSTQFSYNFPLGFLSKLNKMSSLRVKPQS